MSLDTPEISGVQESLQLFWNTLTPEEKMHIGNIIAFGVACESTSQYIMDILTSEVNALGKGSPVKDLFSHALLEYSQLDKSDQEIILNQLANYFH